MLLFVVRVVLAKVLSHYYADLCIGCSSLLNIDEEEHVASSIEKGIKEQIDLLVVCRGGLSSLQQLDQPHSEGLIDCVQ